jgi:hypothetical protein
MTSWVGAYAPLSLLGGLIRFYEFWRLPLGAIVIALYVMALYFFRDPSPWRSAPPALSWPPYSRSHSRGGNAHARQPTT